MTEVAAEGLNLSGQLEWLVARTPEEFAKKICAVHQDQSLNVQLAAAALYFIRRNFNNDTTQRLLAEAITGSDSGE
jgi:transcription initiation factor TFIIIB Brf1 subunit/transcription initiation factor TFIIB